MNKTTIVWFRRDLRLDENPAFLSAAKRGGPIIPLFIVPHDSGSYKSNLFDILKNGVVDGSSESDTAPWLGSEFAWSKPATWWLKQSLQALDNELRSRGSQLIIRSGPILSVLLEVAFETHAHLVYWNRHPHSAPFLQRLDIPDDDRLAMDLCNFDLNCEVFSSDLLYEVSDVWKKRNKKPFKSFDSFFRVCCSLPSLQVPQPPPSRFTPYSGTIRSDGITAISRLEAKREEKGDGVPQPTLDAMAKIWTPGFEAAQDRLVQFLVKVLRHCDSIGDNSPRSPIDAIEFASSGDPVAEAYSNNLVRKVFKIREECKTNLEFEKEFLGKEIERDIQASSKISSLLGPHLHFGEISPKRVVQLTSLMARQDGRASVQEFEYRMMKNLARRDHAHHLLARFPHMLELPLNCKFNAYPWNTSALNLVSWQRAATGFPIVDASIQCLLQTTHIPDPMIRIAAAFLVKYLCIPWQAGARFFWGRLCCADLAVLSYGWQLAACSLPGEFSEFLNTDVVKEGKEADPEGVFIRRWLPALRNLPQEFLYSPWDAPEEVLANAGVKLRQDYPLPIVSPETASTMSNHAYEMMRTAGPRSVLAPPLNPNSSQMSVLTADVDRQRQPLGYVQGCGARSTSEPVRTLSSNSSSQPSVLMSHNLDLLTRQFNPQTLPVRRRPMPLNSTVNGKHPNPMNLDPSKVLQQLQSRLQDDPTTHRPKGSIPFPPTTLEQRRSLAQLSLAPSHSPDRVPSTLPTSYDGFLRQHIPPDRPSSLLKRPQAHVLPEVSPKRPRHILPVSSLLHSPTETTSVNSMSNGLFAPQSALNSHIMHNRK